MWLHDSGCVWVTVTVGSHLGFQLGYPRRRARAIRLSTAVAGLAVAGIAAYVSHWPPTRLSGPTETGITARLEPTTIDGLV
jgi:hypothetical protein